MDGPKRLAIGDLARRTGTKVNTIRFYEDIGLLPRPIRTASGRRSYDVADVRRLSFIRHGRGLGFAVEEIRSLLALSDQPERDCAEAPLLRGGTLPISNPASQGLQRCATRSPASQRPATAAALPIAG